MKSKASWWEEREEIIKDSYGIYYMDKKDKYHNMEDAVIGLCKQQRDKELKEILEDLCKFCLNTDTYQYKQELTFEQSEKLCKIKQKIDNMLSEEKIKEMIK